MSDLTRATAANEPVNGRRTVKRGCHLCEAMCGLELDVADGRVVAVRGDDEDPLSRGYLCPKGASIGALHEDPDRLRQPLIRDGDGFRTASWDEALDRAAAGFRATIEAHGHDAIATYLGNPTVHSHGSLFMPLLLKALGARKRFTASTADQRPHEFANHQMFGHQLQYAVPDLDRCDHLLILGANPLVSNGSIMSAPDIRNRLAAIRERGRVVVVDPRRTETARKADEHHAIRPGTDWLLLAALCRLLLEAGAQLGHLEEHVHGMEALARAVDPVTPELAARHTGIDADTIRRMATDLHEAERAAVYGRLGICHQRNASVAAWLLHACNLVAGHLDTPGGTMFTTPAVDVLQATGKGGHARWTSRVREFPETAGELPSALMAEEIATPGEGRIRAMLVNAGNPVLSTANGSALDEALATLDHLVAIDIYVTETSRHADVILPPVSPLERSHYDHVFHVLAVRNTARWSPPVFEPPEDGRHDWQIYAELAGRLTGRSAEEVIAERFGDARSPDDVVDLGLQLSPYAAPDGSHPGLSLETLREHPSGVDLGPLESRVPERLFTDDKRIDAAPSLFVDALATGLAELPDEPDDAIRLIGRRHLRSNNSWMHNLDPLVKGRDRCTLLVHPEDAGRHGLADGAAVTVRSRVGSVTLPCEVTDDIAEGVVSIPHGWGHARDGVGWTTAAANPGVSVNDLTDPDLLDRLTGNSAFSEVTVTLEPA